MEGDVLDFVNLGDKRSAGRQRLDHVVDPVDAQQGHPSPVGARYRAHCERCHLAQQLGQPQTVRDQAREVADPGPQIGVIGAELLRCPRSVNVPGELHHCRYLHS
jgi:hypothetical protein